MHVYVCNVICQQSQGTCTLYFFPCQFKICNFTSITITIIITITITWSYLTVRKQNVNANKHLVDFLETMAPRKRRTREQSQDDVAFDVNNELTQFVIPHEEFNTGMDDHHYQRSIFAKMGKVF